MNVLFLTEIKSEVSSRAQRAELRNNIFHNFIHGTRIVPRRYARSSNYPPPPFIAYVDRRFCDASKQISSALQFIQEFTAPTAN